MSDSFFTAPSQPEGSGQPGQPAPGADMLGAVTTVPQQGPKQSGRRTALVAGAAAIAIAAAASAGYAYSALSGGGKQPEDVLASGAMAFAKIDLDPSAGQKVAVYQLTRKLPGVASKVTGDSDGSGLKRSLLDSVLDEAGLDYDTDVKPWIGDRAAVAAYPGATGEESAGQVVAAIAYTDEAKAKTSLDHLSTRTGGFAYALVDGYVLVSDSQAALDAETSAAAKGKLGSDSQFSGDLGALDGDQIALGWVDLALTSAVPGLADGAGSALGLGGLLGIGDAGSLGTTTGSAAKSTGRFVLALHANRNFIELQGKGREVKVAGAQGEVATSPVTLLSQLPDSALGVLAVTGLGDALAATLEALPADTRDQLEESGVPTGQDVRAVLGDELAVAVTPDGGSPVGAGVSVRTRTSQADRALVVLDKLLTKLPADSGVSVAKTGDGISLTLGKVAPGSGNVTRSDAFAQAVPDADDAGMVLFVDVAKAYDVAAAQSTDGPLPDSQDVRHLKAVGLSATGGPNSAMRLRITVK